MISLEMVFLLFFKIEFWKFCYWLCLMFLSHELLTSSTDIWCLRFICASGTPAMVLHRAAVLQDYHCRKTNRFFLFLIRSDQTCSVTQNYLTDMILYLGQAYRITVPRSRSIICSISASTATVHSEESRCLIPSSAKLLNLHLLNRALGIS